MTGWHAKKEFVSARAECQLVKDGVRSWEAVRLQLEKRAVFASGAAPRRRRSPRRKRTQAGAADGADQGVFLWAGVTKLAPLHGPALPLPGTEPRTLRGAAAGRRRREAPRTDVHVGGSNLASASPY